jgi:hypothetical protein
MKSAKRAAARVWGVEWSKYHCKPYPSRRPIFPSVPSPEVAAVWYWEIGVPCLKLNPSESPMALTGREASAHYTDFIVTYSETLKCGGLRRALRAHKAALVAAGAVPLTEKRPELA